MTDDKEISGSDVDRGALDLLLGWYTPQRPFDPHEAGIEALNDAWGQMARVLAALPDSEFDDLLANVRLADAIASQEVAPHGRAKTEEADKARFTAGAAARAAGLLALIVDWRHGTWEADEIAAGRDPHQIATPQEGA